MVFKTVEILKNGGIVVFPTETVYGLGVDMFNENAVKKLYVLKKRDKNKPLAIAVSGFEQLKEFVKDVPKTALDLIKQFWPGPLTILLEASGNVPCYLGMGGKIGIRNPDNKKTLEIIRKLGNPIALTSANLSGEKNCKDVNEIKRKFKNKIDAVIENKEKSLGIESTVIDLTGLSPKIIREGYIKKNEIDVCLHGK